MIRTTLAAGGALGALSAGGALWLRHPHRNRYYEGPERLNFDGVRFRNLDTFGNQIENESRGFRDLMRWRAEGGRTRWPDRDPSPFRDRPPARVDGRDLRITFVGHASFLVQTAGFNILLDPVWSERASPFSFMGPRRVNDPGIPFDDLPPIHLILLSHNHYDHMDVATLAALRGAHRPRIVAPLGNDAILRRAVSGIAVETLDWGEELQVGQGIRVHLEPAVHWSARGFTDRRHALWGSFVIETDEGCVYFVGDTGFGDGSVFRSVGEAYGRIRAALLPIGAYEPRWFMQAHHMNPEEAVRALELSGAEVAIAHHWGTFQLTDEGVRDPAIALDRALAARGADASRFPVLRPGQVWEG